MSLQTIARTMAAALGLVRDYGVIVSDVWPGGPAAAAGLSVGDILVSVDGQVADNLPTVSYNFRLRDSSENVQLVVIARDERSSASASRRGTDGASSIRCRRWPTRRRTSSTELGILGVEIDRRIAASATRLRDPYGIIVVARAAGARSEVPLMPRDVIRSVNNRRTATLDGPRETVRAFKPGTPVTLQIQREGRLMYISFIFE